MAEAENTQPVKGELISAAPTPTEQARYSALFAAVDLAKSLPEPAGGTLSRRVDDTLNAADQIYGWLTGFTAA